jgi:hypothetical protein
VHTYDTATTPTGKSRPLARLCKDSRRGQGRNSPGRWGDEEAKQYDPLTNCFTIQTWNKLGYRVKKGEKAIRSITYVAGKDQAETINEDEDKDEQEVRTYPKTVYLFYRTQVEKR